MPRMRHTLPTTRSQFRSSRCHREQHGESSVPKLWPAQHQARSDKSLVLSTIGRASKQGPKHARAGKLCSLQTLQAEAQTAQTLCQYSQQLATAKKLASRLMERAAPAPAITSFRLHSTATRTSLCCQRREHDRAWLDTGESARRQIAAAYEVIRGGNTNANELNAMPSCGYPRRVF